VHSRRSLATRLLNAIVFADYFADKNRLISNIFEFTVDVKISKLIFFLKIPELVHTVYASSVMRVINSRFLPSGKCLLRWNIYFSPDYRRIPKNFSLSCFGFYLNDYDDWRISFKKFFNQARFTHG